MFKREEYIARREALIREVGCRGVVVIPGNELSPNSYQANAYYFRQDATFRYFFGLDRPSLWGIIDLDSRESMLFGERQTLDDIIWSGGQPSLEELAAEVGIEANRCEEISALRDFIAKAKSQGRKIHILPPYRGESKIAIAQLLGIDISQIKESLSAELIFAVAALRERKSHAEIEAIERCYEIGYQMHTTAMRMTRPGVVEREIGGTLEGIARSMGAGVTFPPICTQHGETLHNISREGVLEDGRLLLCDAGGETLEGYCSDHTRTYPINGCFSPLQRDLYNVVLAAQRHIASIATPSMPYTHLQSECYRILGEGLRGLGFLRGTMDQILESGAVSLFMPHGVGHGLGLDVHDCEAFGERTFDITKYRELAENSTSCILRKSWILNPGTVLTNEPGIYFIPELIERRRTEGIFRDIVNYDLLAQNLDFGGIRIEDDLIITESGALEVGYTYINKIPRTTAEIEEFMKE